MSSKYSLKYKKSAVKYLNRLEKDVSDKIIFYMLKISQGFEEGLDIERMKGFVDMYRLRIGGLRVVYQKDQDILVILVIKIGPRGDVYK